MDANTTRWNQLAVNPETGNTVQYENNTEYGTAANGTDVGSGFDVTVKRESKSIAMVNVISLSTKTEWLGPVDIDVDQDLQLLAVDIGNCPGPWLEEMACDDDDDDQNLDDWNAYADRWNAIEVRSETTEARNA
jgi:hypothetical protein